MKPCCLLLLLLLLALLLLTLMHVVEMHANVQLVVMELSPQAWKRIWQLGLCHWQITKVAVKW